METIEKNTIKETINNIEEGSVISVIWGKNLRILYCKVNGMIIGGIRYLKDDNIEEVIDCLMRKVCIHPMNCHAKDDLHHQLLMGRDYKKVGQVADLGEYVAFLPLI